MSATTIAPPESRDLTAEEQEARGQLCHDINDRIIESLSQGRVAMLELAHALYDFHQETGWSSLGFAKQEDWLAQPEINITTTDYFRLIRRWRELVVVRHIDTSRLAQLEPSKIDIVMPAIEDNKVSADDALHDAEALGARDLREKYRGRHTPASPPPDGGATDGEDDDDPDAPIDVEAKSVTVDGAPVNAADVGEDKATIKARKEAAELRDKINYAGGMVDSWLSVGGDRRKADRNWRKLLAIHPLLVSMTTIGRCITDDEGAPSKEEAREAWETVSAVLGVELDDGS